MPAPLIHVMAVALLAAMLSGCAALERADSRVERDNLAVEEIRGQMLRGASSRAVTQFARPKLAGETIVLGQMERLPGVFDETVMYVTAGQHLGEVLAELSLLTGLPMLANEYAGQAQSTDSSSLPSSSTARPLRINWNNSLRGLLDQLAGNLGLSWRYDSKRNHVEFFLLETRHFHVSLPMGARTMTASISGSGTLGTATNSGNTGGIGVNVQGLLVDPYNAIARTLMSMLLEDVQQVDLVAENQAARSATGTTQATASTVRANVGTGNRASRVVVNPELATVTVTAPPASLERIEAYLTSVNERFTRNLTIDVRVFDVGIDEAAGVGFSADLLYTAMNKYGLRITGAPGVPIGASPPGQVTFSVTDPAARFNGSTLLARALSEFGKASVVTSGQVLAINGQPAPFQVANQISYLASSSTREVGGTDSPRLETTLTPGTIVVGLTANFLPQILADNRILLQYQLTVSSLRALNTVNSGTALIQTPNVFTQSVQQQAVLRDGQSIVLFGFADERVGVDGNTSPIGISRARTGSKVLRVIQIQVFGGGENHV